MDANLILRIGLWAVPVLFSIVLHEVSHGWMASRLGDTTAKEQGRLTLNPLPHLDPVGTLILPFVMIIIGGPVFGWAKPVPFNPFRFHSRIDPRKGAMLVALAGPVTNFLLAFIGSFVFVLAQKTLVGLPSLLTYSILQLVQALVFINLVLGTFNLVPIPPLDGSKVLLGLLPEGAASHYLSLERYGFLLIMILLATGALSGVIMGPVRFLYRLFYAIPATLLGLV